MFYEPKKSDHGMRRDPFKCLIVPRPIAWVSTLSKKGIANLAPFSFYNGVSTNPPIVVFGVDMRPGVQVAKDTQLNIDDTGEFVVNFPTYALRDEMIRSSEHVGHGVSEFELAGLEMMPSKLVASPRVKGAPVHLECKHLQTVVLPCNEAGRANYAIFGEVIGIHIDDSIIEDGSVNIVATRPIARLGYLDYTTVDSAFSLARPD